MAKKKIVTKSEQKPKTSEEVAAKKREFLRRVFRGNEADFIRQAWRDATGHARIYNANAPIGSEERGEVKDFAQAKTVKIAAKIKADDDGGFVYSGESETATAAVGMLVESGVSIAHIGHVIALRDAVTDEHGGSLADGNMRFGFAQKLLNMYLKYMWCAGEMPTPPHCPFDRRIIFGALPNHQDEFWGALGQMGEITWNWTQSDSVEDYLVWLAAADEMKKHGKYNSLAEWELFEFEGA